MKREIKFRAWDKTENVMSYSDVEMFDDMVGFRFGHFGINVDTVDDINLMQFTGLHDKNGREIYEGDIIGVEFMRRPFNLKGQWGRKRDNEIFEVVYSDAWGAFGGTEGGAIFFFHDMEEIKVIGNIYENPDYLN